MELRENHDQHLGDFVRLNEEWITKYFAIEEADRALAANPRKVIDDGGYIFSLSVDDEVVGVCALYRKHGFVTIMQGRHPVYARADIVMERSLR